MHGYGANDISNGDFVAIRLDSIDHVKSFNSVVKLSNLRYGKTIKVMIFFE
jgi:hypothetical protein